MNPPKPASLLPTFAKWLTLIAAFLTLLWLNQARLLALLDFFRDRQAVAAYLETMGAWGPFFYLLILAAQVLTVFLPGQILMISAGYLYGFDMGLGLNLIGAVGASQLAFVLGRWSGRPLVQRLIPVNLYQRWHDLAQRQGFLFYLLCFLFPIIPTNLTNYLGGLSSISFWGFFLASLLGRLPGLILMTLIGSHGLDLSWQQWLLIAVAGLVSMAGGRYLTVKLTARFGAS